jgi:hypothetical protein
MKMMIRIIGHECIWGPVKRGESVGGGGRENNEWWRGSKYATYMYRKVT